MPEPTGSQLLIILALAVCVAQSITDGDIAAHYPIVPGHEIVGHVIGTGPEATGFGLGDRVGATAGAQLRHLSYCRSGRENLCDTPTIQGQHWMAATPVMSSRIHVSACPSPILWRCRGCPLLCAGLIAIAPRSWRARRFGILWLWRGGAYHRPGCDLAGTARPCLYPAKDLAGQAFARSSGCCWGGGLDEPPPEELDAATIFAAVGPLVLSPARCRQRQGRMWHPMSDILAFPYEDLWGERSILSVANLTRETDWLSMTLALQVPVRTQVRTPGIKGATDRPVAPD
jgi:propanol-preferring alcohol dehydrogenase